MPDTELEAAEEPDAPDEADEAAALDAEEVPAAVEVLELPLPHAVSPAATAEVITTASTFLKVSFFIFLTSLNLE